MKGGFMMMMRSVNVKQDELGATRSERKEKKE